MNVDIYKVAGSRSKFIFVSVGTNIVNIKIQGINIDPKIFQEKVDVGKGGIAMDDAQVIEANIKEKGYHLNGVKIEHKEI
jgi:hypothetical protein